jgi:hypothetical protein
MNIYDLGYSKNIIRYEPLENIETKNTFDTSSFSSLQENSRVEISPDDTIGIRIKDDADNEVFKAMVGGIDVGDVIIGDYSNGQGLKYDKSENTTTFAGALSAATGTLGSIEVVGNFTLGTTTVSISSTDSIQDTIDEINALGGGTIILQPGIYTLSDNITLYNNIKLEGQSPKDTIITFNNTANSVLIKGSLVYNTGTISISPGETTVVGVGTLWSANVEVGQYILLGESDWFQITEVTDDTHLTVDVGYFGRTLSGDTYKIAIIKSNTSINNLGVIQSSTHGIDTQYTKNLKMFNVFSLYHGGDAMKVDNTNWNILDYVILGYSARGMYVNETYNSSFDRYFIASNTGTGLVYEGGSQDNSFRFLKLYSNNVGAEIKDSNNNTFTRVDSRYNTLQGVIFNGGEHTSIDAIVTENGSDGIKLMGDSDNIVIDGSLITDNGGYGVNISAATCNNTLIDSSQFKDNTSGNLNDSGTDTKIGTNMGVDRVNFTVTGLSIYANNAAAITGGLSAGDFYRTGGDPDYVCVVH